MLLYQDTLSWLAQTNQYLCSDSAIIFKNNFRQNKSNNSSNINKTVDHVSPQAIERKNTTKYEVENIVIKT